MIVIKKFKLGLFTDIILSFLSSNDFDEEIDIIRNEFIVQSVFQLKEITEM